MFWWGPPAPKVLGSNSKNTSRIHMLLHRILIPNGDLPYVVKVVVAKAGVARLGGGGLAVAKGRGGGVVQRRGLVLHGPATHIIIKIRVKIFFLSID